MTRVAEVPRILAAHGITTGPDGYRWTALEAVPATHGWQYSVEAVLDAAIDRQRRR